MHISHRNAKLVTTLFAICLAITFVGCDDEGESPNGTLPSTIRGSFNIYYSVQTSETEGYSTGNTPHKVMAIHFYDEYIVVETGKGSGRIIPVRQIKTFRWDTN